MSSVDWQSAPLVSRDTIVAGVQQAGVAAGDVVLVHASLSALGRVAGGATSIVEALREVVGQTGTVLFPTLTGSRELGRDNPPVFRPHLDPCWTGKIPETARRHPAAVRSLGPTHSVCAIGYDAHWFTVGHELCETPCGILSPYHKLRMAEGKVLFIGVGLASATIFHHIEEAADAPYVCQPEPVIARIVLPDDTVLTVPTRLHLYGPARNYPAFEPELTAAGILAHGQAGQATLRVLQAKPLCEAMIPRVRRDPTILLADPERYDLSRWCEPALLMN